MFSLIALPLLLTPVPGNDTPTQEIVVVANRQKCDVSLDNRILSASQLDAKARQWASGTAVRVRARTTTDLKCLSKIAFKLAGRGVKLIEFVDPDGKPASPFPVGAGKGIPKYTSGSSSPASGDDSFREREWRFLETRAAKLILDGKCDEAKRILLEAGDLSGAANVVTLCKAP